MPAVRHPDATRPAAVRSRITNHADLLGADLDGRSSPARRFRDLVLAFISDAGGVEACSAVKVGLLRRLAAASVLVEAMESKAVAGKAVDVNAFCQLASTCVRLSTRLGLNRVAKDVGSDLVAILKAGQRS